MQIGDLVYDKELEMQGVVLEIEEDGSLILVEFTDGQRDWCYPSQIEVIDSDNKHKTDQ